jgi:hypothetical protein
MHVNAIYTIQYTVLCVCVSTHNYVGNCCNVTYCTYSCICTFGVILCQKIIALSDYNRQTHTTMYSPKEDTTLHKIIHIKI